MSFSIVKEVFNIEEVFFLLIKKDFNNCCKDVVTRYLSLFFIIIKTSLMILIFFIGLVKISRLLLTRYISREEINRLIFFRVFIIFCCLFVSLRISNLNFLDH